jgi:hypothetical protein
MIKADSYDMARIPIVRKDIMEKGKAYAWQPSKKQGGKRKKVKRK